MTTPEPPAAQPQPSGPGTPAPLADWGTRAVGFLIDYLPILILDAIVYWNGFLRGIGGLVTVAYVIYIGYMEGLTGQTPGKAVMGLRLVNQQGDVIGSGPGIGRKFAHIVDSLVCLLGWLLPIVDANRQTIADKLLQTYVVSGAEKKQFTVELWTQPPQQSGGPATGDGPAPGDTPEGGGGSQG